MREVFLLKLRDAVAEKEWIIAQANHELYQGGWRSGWDKAMGHAQAQIDHWTECVLSAQLLCNTPEEAVEAIKAHRAAYRAV
jgi:hypothetical protein